PVVHVPPDVAGERAVSLKTRLLLAILTVGSAAVGVIPRHTIGEALCRLAGSVWYLSAPAARAAVRANLRHIIGREPHWRQVVTVFQHGAFNYWDTLLTPHLTQAQFRELMVVHGAEHIESALAGGHGVVCATAHLGSVAYVS